MATTTIDKNRCDICKKEKRTVRCEGCSKILCYHHLEDHREELNKQLDDVEVSRDAFQQLLIDETSQPDNHPLMRKIDEWERDSIKKIRQTANELRQQLSKYTSGHITQIEVELDRLTNQLHHSRDENDFVETDLNHWKAEINRLEEELINPSNITLQQDSTPFITKIVLDVHNGMYVVYICTELKIQFPHYLIEILLKVERSCLIVLLVRMNKNTDCKSILSYKYILSKTISSTN